eukprot:m.202107 g.202107  ORF g.202107 m.202107 type:complete len:188 (+) comp10691_c0_seq2:6366-6929(+)
MFCVCDDVSINCEELRLPFLPRFPANVFEITINSNRITQILRSDVAHLGQLRQFNIAFNRLTYIEPGSFGNSPLETLFARHNFLPMMPALSTSLKQLTIWDNEMTTLLKSQLEQYPQLVYLDMRENRISSFEEFEAPFTVSVAATHGLGACFVADHVCLAGLLAGILASVKWMILSFPVTRAPTTAP